MWTSLLLSYFEKWLFFFETCDCSLPCALLKREGNRKHHHRHHDNMVMLPLLWTSVGMYAMHQDIINQGVLQMLTTHSMSLVDARDFILFAWLVTPKCKETPEGKVKPLWWIWWLILSKKWTFLVGALLGTTFCHTKLCECTRTLSLSLLGLGSGPMHSQLSQLSFFLSAALKY